MRGGVLVSHSTENRYSDDVKTILVYNLSAMENGNKNEAEHLLIELQPDVQNWLNQDLLNNSIVTGLTR
ncbi:DnaK-type molecular chaperone DnaK [Anabaena cylindrica PCC 7122]|nr:DnaK-type molecular chaperone DnaK [Anabaena cylindrica PCC 7122]